MRRANGVRAIGAARLAALTDGGVQAHHSAATFDDATVVELQGAVKELRWTNPHLAAGARGAGDAITEWSIEGGSFIGARFEDGARSVVGSERRGSRQRINLLSHAIDPPGPIPSSLSAA